MKKLMLLLVLVCLFIGITAIPVVAAQPVKVVLDDENFTFDVPPTIISGRTLVPVRKIVESMGGDVAWKANNKTVTVNRDNTAIVLVINSKNARVGSQVKTLDVPAKLINGRTLIPLRFVSENFGADVKWDQHTRTVSIATSKSIDDNALDLLARAFTKNREVKKSRADLDSNVKLTGVTPDGPLDLKLDIVGTLKSDIEAPAFGFTGKVTAYQGVVGQDVNVDFLMKDGAVYMKDPQSGKWAKEDLSSEDSQAVKDAFIQSQAIQIDYLSLFKQAQDTGAIRNVSFAGGKDINGKPSKAVYVELNGLKIADLLKNALSNGQSDPGMAQNIDDALAAFSSDKLKLTFWIGAEDNIIYGTDAEVRFSAQNPDGSFRVELSIHEIISDINKDQALIVPDVKNITDAELPF